jgi:cytidylate kinase
MKKIIIAIDGPAGSGKSTTAKLLAKKLGYLYIDTGAMYRAVTLFWLRSNLPLEEKYLAPLLDNIKVDLLNKNDHLIILLNGEDVSSEIRKPEVTNYVSPISTFESVRNFLVAQQRNLGNAGGVVMDGRDIGTVVFPNAELKIFLVANTEERVRRRLKELQASGIDIDKDEVERQIVERDRIDSQRTHSPLRKSEDAIEIDTTNLTIEQQVEIIYNLALERIKSSTKNFV